jgi:hypothetical protein
MLGRYQYRTQRLKKGKKEETGAILIIPQDKEKGKSSMLTDRKL